MKDINQKFYETMPDTKPAQHGKIAVGLFRRLFSLLGWRFLGEIPREKKAIVVIAPHTSNWDFFILMVAKFALQLKASYVMKKEAFFWPFKNWLMWVGGIPVDRSQPAAVVGQVAEKIAEQEKIWVVITPEGTRKKVPHYKTGFLRIADAAQIPVMIVGLDYEKKAVIFSKTFQPETDFEKQAAEIRDFCRQSFVGYKPEYQ